MADIIKKIKLIIAISLLTLVSRGVGEFTE